MPPSAPELPEDLKISELNSNGEGVSSDGRIVFGALPGERVLARKRPTSFDVVEVIEPSLDRQSPICPHFGRCGGCAAQHMSAEVYAEWKRGMVVNALRAAKIGARVEPLVDAHGAGRRRVTFHVRFEPSGAPRVGFMRRRSHEIVAIDRCPLLAYELQNAPEIALVLAALLAPLATPLDVQSTVTLGGIAVDIRGAGPLPSQIAVALVEGAQELDLARLSVHGRTLIERRAPLIQFGQAKVRFPPGGFLQATEAGDSEIAKLALRALGTSHRIADLFCGCGAFSLRIDRQSDVLAVDVDRASVESLKQATFAEGQRRPIRAEVRDLLRLPLDPVELRSFDAVIFDPPRAGADLQAKSLANSDVRLAVAVSCNPATFARDARNLIEGGYQIAEITPLDQFRFSSHVEIVGVFERKSRARRSRGLLN